IELHVGAGPNHQGATSGGGYNLSSGRADLNGSSTGFHVHITTHFADPDISATAGGKNRTAYLVQVDRSAIGLQLHEGSLAGDMDIEVNEPMGGVLSFATDDCGIAGGVGDNMQPAEFMPCSTF